MKTFSEFLNEHYINVFNVENKNKYKHEVWKLLTSSYAPIGGIHGTGFESPDDMVKNIPMWKMVKKNGEIIAVAMYKDYNGRKRVAIGTNGSEEGRLAIRKIVASDFDRAYFEVSGPSFFSILKNVGIDFLQKYVKSREQVEQILSLAVDDPDENDEMMKRAPSLKHYMYSREIAGSPHTKIMLGTSGNKISIKLGE